MRRFTLIWLVSASIFLAAAAPWQAVTPPPPTPSPLESCLSEGDFVKCIPILWREYRWWGLLGLAVVGLLIYFLFAPAAEALRDKIKTVITNKISPPPQTGPEAAQKLIQAATVELLKSLGHNPVEFSDYVDRLRKEGILLSEKGEAQFVGLEVGLGFDLRPRLGLALPVEAGAGKQSFAEKFSYKDLNEAITAVDEQNGSPYPALALLGEPGSGKTTLLRKITGDIALQRLANPTAPIPLFISLAAHKSGSPLEFLTKHWLE